MLIRRSRHGVRQVRASVVGLFVGLVVALSTGVGMSAFQSFSAQAATSSAVTLKAKDVDITRVTDPMLANAPLPDLEVTVSQTTGLLSQAVTVSWTGGKQSVAAGGSDGGQNFLQIAQCWGEDPSNPGHPDRTTCQMGGFGSQGYSTRMGSAECQLARDAQGNLLENANGDNYYLSPRVSAQDYSYTAGVDSDYSSACRSGSGPVTAIPFRAVDNQGTISAVMPNPAQPTNPSRVTFLEDYFSKVISPSLNVPVQANVGGVQQNVVGVNLADNQFYGRYTTNEVPWAGSGSDGTGSVKFEIQTAVQNPYLGCGNTTTSNGVTSEPQSCWLVVIPRGTHDSGSSAITKPGIWWDAWQHNIAFKLDFRPTAQRCAIGAAERALSGSALAEGAISSWQPKLCTVQSGATFVVSTGNEAAALTKASGTNPSPLALTSRPLQTTSKDPVQYAPVALSGIAISFAIDRFAVPDIYAGHTTPADYILKNGTSFTSMNLTPRLVAKLLTNSYVSSLPYQASRAEVGYVSSSDRGHNALNLTFDPDFLSKQSTDEWYYQYLNAASLADLLVPNGQSDLAVQLWDYVMSDQEGRDFMAGMPDEWGMTVNPYYSTAANSFSPATTYPLNTFPKADPIASANTLPADLTLGNDSVNLLTYRPYVADFASGAYNTLRGDGLVLGNWNPNKSPKGYDREIRSLVGSQKVLAVTTTEAAARYGAVTASLRNPAGQFVAPNVDSLASAAAAMTPSTKNPAVFGVDFASAQMQSANGAYPLAMPVFAASNPLQTDGTQRATYAAFIRYAAQQGQNPGHDTGQLPDGYAPIPKSWVDQSMISANAIEQGISPQSLVQGVTSVPAGSGVVGGTTANRGTTGSTNAKTSATPAPTTATSVTALTGKPTPSDPVLGPVSAAVPAGIVSGFGAAVAVPFYSRFRRRL